MTRNRLQTYVDEVAPPPSCHRFPEAFPCAAVLAIIVCHPRRLHPRPTSIFAYHPILRDLRVEVDLTSPPAETENKTSARRDWRAYPIIPSPSQSLPPRPIQVCTTLTPLRRAVLSQIGDRCSGNRGGHLHQLSQRVQRHVHGEARMRSITVKLWRTMAS